MAVLRILWGAGAITGFAGIVIAAVAGSMCLVVLSAAIMAGCIGVLIND